MKLLETMTPSDDVEEMEILKARFDTFDQEMNANADKVSTVNNLAAQLIDGQHPNSDEAKAREDEVNRKWDELRQVADEKRAALQLSHECNTWHMEVQETKTWIREKAKLIESTDELGSDLGGVITLQRRLSGLERDLAAIEAKRDALNEEADRLATDKPEEAAAIRERIEEMTEQWLELKQMVSHFKMRSHFIFEKLLLHLVVFRLS